MKERTMKLTPAQVDELLVGTKYEKSTKGSLSFGATFGEHLWATTGWNGRYRIGHIVAVVKNKNDNTLFADAKLNAALAIHYKTLAGELIEALSTMKHYASRTHDHWDADEDSKVGKWLISMAGCSGILPDIDKALTVLDRAKADLWE